MAEAGYGNRVEDKMSPLGQITRKNPLAALVIASFGSFVTSMLTVMGLMTSPISANVQRIQGELQIAEQHIHDITKRIGSAPRAAPDVAKLYQRTDDLKEDVKELKRKTDTFQESVARLGGVVVGLQRDCDKIINSQMRRNQ